MGRDILDFYRSLGVFHKVDGMRPIKDVTRDILAIIDKTKLRTLPASGGSQKIA